MLLAIFICLLFAYSLVSARLEKTIVTAPSVFTLAGLGVFLAKQPAGGRMDAGAFLMLAEIGLVLLLFTDAARTDLKVLRRIRELPVRLLSSGMLLTILLGALATTTAWRTRSGYCSVQLRACMPPKEPPITAARV